MAIGVEQLRELAHNSFKKISDHQLPSGLIPASVGRYDDEHYNRMVWVKDHLRAIKFALDPHFQQAFPELVTPAKRLYLSSVRSLLQIQGQPEQLRRFQNKPGVPDQNGYSTIDDQLAPAIKFTSDGQIHREWGHNQPDNWGTLLMVVGKGIEARWPVLGRGRNQQIPLGAIVQEVTSYVVNLRTERLTCRSIWEHKKAWSSYSTRRIVLSGLEQMETVWPEIVADGKKRGYPIKLGSQQIQEAAGSLSDKVREHFPADYTDVEGHEFAADLASLVVLNDVRLPAEEQTEILKRAVDLENRLGFYRYFGDPWKQGRAEAKWTMGKPIMGRYQFNQSMLLYSQGRHREAFRALDHGLDRIEDILVIITTHGRVPELFEDRDKDGIYLPNNNELAWTLGYLEEAAGAGIIAMATAEQFYQHAT